MGYTHVQPSTLPHFSLCSLSPNSPLVFVTFTKVAALRHCFGEISSPCRQCSLMLRTSSRLLPVNSKEHDLLCSPLNCNKPHIISARNSGTEFGICSEFRSGSTEVKHVFTTDLLETFHPACLVSIRLLSFMFLPPLMEVLLMD